MFTKGAFVLVGFLFAMAVAYQSQDLKDSSSTDLHSILVRQIRSPDGSVDLTYKDDRAGREASVNYNQNIYKSDDGRVNVDAYAHGSRNFDTNRNDYGGGIRGSIRF